VIQRTPVMHPPECTGPHGLSQGLTGPRPLTSTCVESTPFIRRPWGRGGARRAQHAGSRR